MKKLATLFLTLLLLAGAACGGTASPGDAELKALLDNFPLIDGSTSTIPMETAIRAALFDISVEEAGAAVKHTTTHGSFDRLISGECDLVLSVPISAAQRQKAADASFPLEEKPVAREAFVFLVNADNPIDSLTQQQIKDIYSGKITNWKEVGGNDATILAYQRNLDSGSQSYMIDFMGDTELMDPLGFAASGMESLIDVVATYDGAENAIGYSVYTYAADMYTGGGRVKLLSVDGTAPNTESLSSGTYPLLSYNYAYYSSNQPAGATVPTLLDWLLTDKGQAAIASLGYIPLRKLDIEIELKSLMYKSSGTGPARTDIPAGDEYLCHSLRTESFLQPFRGTGGEVDFVLTLLSDGEKNKILSEWIDKARTKMLGQIAPLQGFIKAKNESVEPFHDRWSIATQNYILSDLSSLNSHIESNFTVQNGYFSGEIFLSYYTPESAKIIYDVETVVVKIDDLEYMTFVEKFSDLFFEGSDFVGLINDRLEDYAADGRLLDVMKSDTIYLPAGIKNFTLDTIYFGKNNPVIETAKRFFWSPTKDCVVTRPDRMEGLVTVPSSNYTQPFYTGRKTLEEREFFPVYNYPYDPDDPNASIRVAKVVSNEFISGTAAEKIDAYMRDYAIKSAAKTVAEVIDEYSITSFARIFTMKMDDSWLVEEYKDGDGLNKYLSEHGATIERVLSDEGGRKGINEPLYSTTGPFVTFWRASKLLGDYTDSGPGTALCLPESLIFNAKTGEKAKPSDFLKEGWEQASEWYSNIDLDTLKRPRVEPKEANSLVLTDIPYTLSVRDWSKDDNVSLPYAELFFMEPTGYTEYLVRVPVEYFTETW